MIVRGRASGSIDDATIEENGVHGVLLQDDATTQVVGSTLRDNGIHGIVFEDASSGSVVTSVLSGNGGCGVYRNDPDAVELSDNTYDDSAGPEVCQPS